MKGLFTTIFAIFNCIAFSPVLLALDRLLMTQQSNLQGQVEPFDLVSYELLQSKNQVDLGILVAPQRIDRRNNQAPKNILWRKNASIENMIFPNMPQLIEIVLDYL